MRSRRGSWWTACALAIVCSSLRAPSLHAQEIKRATAAKQLSAQKSALPEGAVKLEPASVTSERPTAVPAAPDPAPATNGGASAQPVTPKVTRPPRVRTGEQLIQLPLAVEGASAMKADSLRVISAGGAQIKSEAGSTNAPVLELPANGRAIVSSEQGKKSAERDPIGVERKTPLPWLVIETERHGDTQAVRAARPFLTLAKAITWNARVQLHVAEFLFGLDPEGGTPGPLQQPIEARFSVSCDDVAPELAQVAKIGPAGYGSVRVRCSPAVKNEQAQQFLTVHVEQGMLRYPFEIPRRPGALRLTASALRVPGFGFGSLALTGEQLEEDGSLLRAAEATELQLSADQSGLDASAVTIAKGESASTIEVHPRGVGPLALVLEHGALRSPPLQLQRTVPWLALAAMIGGGMIGGVLFLFGPRRKPSEGEAGPASIWLEHPSLRRAVEGALVGLLVTAFVLIVPSFAALTSAALSSELGLFVIAAIAGFAGTPLLDLAARALFPALGKSGG